MKQEQKISNGVKKKIIIILIIVVLLVAGGVGYYLHKTSQEEKEKLEEKEAPGEKPESELKSLSGTWNFYTNYKLGFSMKVPKEMLHGHGSCKWVDAEKSYRLKEALVPIKIYEDIDDNVVYISSEYFYELTEARGEKYCNKVINSLELIKESNYWPSWKIVVREVANDSELEQFIKERYGFGCGLGQKTPTKQEGVYSVGIDTGGARDIDEAMEIGCVVNYRTVLKYLPAKNKVISWNLGQADTFSGREDVVYDAEMFNSFNFLVTEEESADWKTYSNEKYGFSFAYPSNFRLTEGFYSSGLYLEDPTIFELVLVQDIYPPAQIPVIDLEVVKTDKTIEQLLDYLKEAVNKRAKLQVEDPESPFYGSAPPEIKSIETITIGGLKTTKVVHYTGPGAPLAYLSQYYIMRPGYVFVFSANYDIHCSPGVGIGDCGATEKEILLRILPTLEFIK